MGLGLRSEAKSSMGTGEQMKKLFIVDVHVPTKLFVIADDETSAQYLAEEQAEIDMKCWAKEIQPKTNVGGWKGTVVLDEDRGPEQPGMTVGQIMKALEERAEFRARQCTLLGTDPQPLTKPEPAQDREYGEISGRDWLDGVEDET